MGVFAGAHIEAVKILRRGEKQFVLVIFNMVKTVVVRFREAEMADFPGGGSNRFNPVLPLTHKMPESSSSMNQMVSSSSVFAESCGSCRNARKVSVS
ncbi:MAG: hypothetical protein R3C26_25995 [Calditrichia bacterium]